MPTTGPLVIAIDFSACSEHALRQGLRVAKWNGSPVRVLDVVNLPLMDPMMPPLFPMTLPTVDVLLDDARRRWADFGPDSPEKAGAHFEVQVGNPRAVILDRVSSLKARMLVLGVFGSAGGSGGLGSTAAACVRKSECDVLLVRQGATGAYQKVAACIDFSPGSRAALDRAIRVAAQDGAGLHILHVYDDPWHGLTAPDVIRRNMPEFRATLNQAVEARMRAFCAPVMHELGGLKAEFHAVQCDPKGGSYGRGIARFIVDRGIDLGVLATHSDWRVRDWLLGSTADRVFRDAPCSLLAVKPVPATQA